MATQKLFYTFRGWKNNLLVRQRDAEKQTSGHIWSITWGARPPKQGSQYERAARHYLLHYWKIAPLLVQN